MADRLLKLVPCELGLDKEEDALAVSIFSPRGSERRVQQYWLDRCPKGNYEILSSSPERMELELELELDFPLAKQAPIMQCCPTYRRASCHEMCA